MSATPMGAETITGRTLGDFVAREKIGEGGFGAVYRAEQRALQREAVIKVLHARHHDAQQVTQRFLREARLASRLDHPFAAHIYAFGAEPDGLLWIAMELVRGTPLDKLLRVQGPLTLERFVPLLDRICEVVHSAHEQGIVHRDIKPANVMVLNRAGRLLPKLLDFGIAKLLDDTATAAPTVERAPLANTNDALAATIQSGLTQDGGYMGSPPYMAPEQWVNAATVGAPADLYALGALCYEALIGKPAFRGNSLMAIARAHATQAPPKLGGSFPPALDEVLARALAKQPDHRYASPLELATAFRAASGLAQEPVNLPHLPKPLEEQLIAGAPQPIAESVAVLEAARNLHQAIEAVWQVLSVTVRYVGVLALASRSQIGPGGESDSPAVGELVRLLRRRTLVDEEWIDLARELCRGFARRRDAHPVAELVSLFYAETGEPIASIFEPLLGLRASAGHGVRGNDAELKELLERLVRELEVLLRGMTFLTDYPLVVMRDGVAQRWMGVRRPLRTSVATAGRGLADGQAALIDGDGAAVLALSPMVQVVPPVPGTPEELFLFEGQGRRGALLYAYPGGFERHDDGLWEWFREHLFSLDGDELHSASITERTPYPGLSAFTPEQADLFFGREREAEIVRNRLRVQSLLAVVGPSGSGKSSFVQAGVLAALAPGWRGITMRPGPAPLAALESRLTREDAGAAGLAAAIARDPDALFQRLAALAGDGVAVLVVDQFEELFTLCLDGVERERFAEALARAARSADAPVRVVLTVRDDFLMRVEQLPRLRERLQQGLMLLGTPATDELTRILTEPARRVGYEFDDRALPGEMVAQLAQQPGALPLLSFTAARLWELRDRHFKQLRRQAYQSMGGVGGALAQHAESTLAQLSPEDQRLVREAFRHLVTSEGTRAVLTRPELLQLLGGSPAAESVVERLVAARLLVASEAEGREDRIEVVHEALLSAWPRLVAWRQEDAEGARLRDQLRAAARQWEERARPNGLLWRGEALAELELWRARHGQALTAVEDAFVRASRAEAARGRRLRRLLVAGVIVALGAGIVTLGAMNRRVAASAADARAHLAQLYEDQGRIELLANHPQQALALLSEAYSGGRDTPALHYLLGRAIRGVQALKVTFEGHTDGIFVAVLSADERFLMTGSFDGTARVWDAATGRQIQVLSGHTKAVTHVGFAPPGRAVTASEDGTVRLWDLADGNTLATLRSPAPILRGQGTADGHRLLTVGDDGAAALWDVEAGRVVASLSGHQGKATFARFSPDGLLAVTIGEDHTVRVWDGRTGVLQRVLAGHEEAIRSVVFSADGEWLATASDDHTARLWKVRTGSLERVLRGHDDAVLAATFSADGRTLATSSGDGTVRLWETSTGRVRARLLARAEMDPMRFSPDGQRLLITTSDGMVRVWSAEGHRLTTLFGHQGYAFIARFDGRRAWTFSYDGTARLWDTRSSDLVQTLTVPSGMVQNARYTALDDRVVTESDGKWLRIYRAEDGREERSVEHPGDGGNVDWNEAGQVAISKDNRMLFWDWTTGQTRPAQAEHQAGIDSVRFSPDGKRVLTTAEDGSVAVWNPASGALVRMMRGHDGAATWGALSPDGRRAATVGGDRTLRLWNLDTGRTERTLTGHAAPINGVAFDRRGQLVVTASDDRTAKVWAADTGQLVATLEGHGGNVGAAGFSPDGALVATAALDGVVRIWETTTGRLLSALEGHKGWVLDSSFSHDGQRLVSCGQDGTARLWNVAPDVRSAAEVRALVRCRVPFRVEEGRLMSSRPDPASCIP